MSQRAASAPRDISATDLATMVNTIKGLSMDAVQKANSGHPGMPMGAACMAATLWTRFMVHDPSDPNWADRDRFVLSAGHGSMLLYSLLHLCGYPLSLEDIKSFRQWGSKTPGHPEVHDTEGVEVTTGPLGTGFATGVGMAVAERWLATRYNRPGHEVVDHFTYGIVSDGDLMEGVASEAASFAGHQKLGKLIYLYDDNQITIDGGTDLAFGEDVGKRFEAYGWQVLRADGHDDGSVTKALEAARAETGKPSLIMARTVIGHGSPNKAGKSSSHGAPLGPEEIEATKKGMDWPLEPFHVPDGLTAKISETIAPGVNTHAQWNERMDAYRAAHPELAAEFEAVLAAKTSEADFEGLPEFEVGTKLATRKASAQVLEALAQRFPSLVGGSADLAGSNGVGFKEGGVLSPEQGDGRNVHFGVREHGMGGIVNGMALHGGMRPFDATFLIFSDFMRGAVRLSALQHLPVVHIYSHDSVFLGEDGPTHQPIEQTMSLRMIPNLHVMRPADANETVGAWVHALKRTDGPTAILLTRQGVPVLEGSKRDVSKGAYVVHEPAGEGELHGILVATGSEVSLAVEVAGRLEAQGKRTRVVSMPCWKAFEAQSDDYKESVLPRAVTRRLSVEAGVGLGWERYASAHQGIDRFGASAPAGVLAEQFGFTPNAVLARYLDLA
ncbi:MAG: transketolase [Nannocystaceae bacterium]|nr:transketolase [bacterium]